MLAQLAVLLWEYPIILVSVVVALGAIGRGLHTLYKWAKSLEEAVTYVAKEMQFNGGATMRDAIKRLEASHEEIKSHLTQQDRTMINTAAELKKNQGPLEVAGALTLTVEES